MKLGDILPLIDEYAEVAVYGTSGRLIAVYNGKDSIDPELNDLEVIKLTPSKDKLRICVEEGESK